ncbi:MAG TPA: AMP-binding protein, partial [Candidatus Eisenbacteria bacterium]|nr:AMP-binding protein [Candidatus Eisenbacteria bacterium]
MIVIHTDLKKKQEAIRAKCFHPSGKFREFRREEVEQSIPSRFEKIVLQYPAQIAIKTQKEALTYTQLDARANGVARAILDTIGETSQPVVILPDDPVEAIVGALGALKAGKFYVPLEPALPAARMRSVLEDLNSKL